jgi:hypothetical protein
MEEEEGVPSTRDTVPVESDLRHAMQSRTDSPSEISHSELSPDGISAAGVSNASSWISYVLAPGCLSFCTATCIVVYLTAASNFLSWTFAQGGPLLTSIVLGVEILQTYITASFVPYRREMDDSYGSS